MEIFAIPAFTDNYIWAVVEKDQFVVVDPGDSLVVKEFAEKNNLQLRAILITHWHPDHTGGIIELVKDKSISVYGPKGGHIDGITDELKEGDSIRIFLIMNFQYLKHLVTHLITFRIFQTKINQYYFVEIHYFQGDVADYLKEHPIKCFIL